MAKKEKTGNQKYNKIPHQHDKKDSRPGKHEAESYSAQDGQVIVLKEAVDITSVEGGSHPINEGKKASDIEAETQALKDAIEETEYLNNLMNEPEATVIGKDDANLASDPEEDMPTEALNDVQEDATEKLPDQADIAEEVSNTPPAKEEVEIDLPDGEDDAILDSQVAAEGAAIKETVKKEAVEVKSIRRILVTLKKKLSKTKQTKRKNPKKIFRKKR